MKERNLLNETPEAVLDFLLETSGGRHWQTVAQSFAGGGADVLAEARWYADKGILTGAVSFAYASGLSPLDKIRMIRELATEASLYVNSIREQSDRIKMTAVKAQRIIQISSVYLDSKTPPNPPVV